MFTPVDGQVILIKADDMPTTVSSPVEYLRKHWNITSDYTITQIQDCMLRGVVDIHDGTIHCASNTKVLLNDDNMPPHMHHPGITSNAKILTTAGSTVNADKVLTRDSQSTAYDMFYNDSFSTGVAKNEMDGVVDNFVVQAQGAEQVYHNNMPVYDKYYAFEIRKNS